MSYIKCLLLLFIFASCRSSRTNEKLHTVTKLNIDSSSLQEIENSVLVYNDLSGILYLTNKVEATKQLTFLSNQPTLVRLSSYYAIIYPGENIEIKIDQSGDIIFTVKDNKERSDELSFLKEFQKMDYKERPTYPGRIQRYPIDTITSFERNLKTEIPAYITKSRALFDSLSTVYNISAKFKNLSNSFFEINVYATLFQFYSDYSTELIENNLYNQKLREILPIYNNIKIQNEINFHGEYYIQSLAKNFMKTNMRNIKTNAEIKEAIDTINNNFNHLSRDYLLSKLLYDAISRRITISKSTLRYYRHSCKDEQYKEIVMDLYDSYKNNSKKSKTKLDNRLIALSDSKIYTLEEVIAQHKGNLILIDIWASWCVPCLEQIPYAEKLRQQFSNDKITFLYLSTDRQMAQWKHKNMDMAIDSANSYLFENFTKQSFLKNNNVSEIPRYILLDQNGKIINADAPRPNEIELKKLIEANLKN